MLVLVPLNMGRAGRRIFPPRLRRGTRHPDAPPSPRSASESVRADTLRAHPENTAAPAQYPSAERRYRPKVTSGCPKRSEGGFPVGTRTITTFPSGTVHPTQSQAEHRFSMRSQAEETRLVARLLPGLAPTDLNIQRNTQGGGTAHLLDEHAFGGFTLTGGDFEDDFVVHLQ